MYEQTRLEDYGVQTDGQAELTKAPLPERPYLFPRMRLVMIRESNDMTSVKKVRSPDDLWALLRPVLEDQPQENLVVVTLDNKNQLIGYTTVYVGSINTTLVRVCEVVRPAILQNALAIVIAHNHPSGDPEPSPEDITFTSSVNDACKLLDLSLLDSVIIGAGRYVSLRERGSGF